MALRRPSRQSLITDRRCCSLPSLHRSDRRLGAARGETTVIAYGPSDASASSDQLFSLSSYIHKNRYLRMFDSRLAATHALELLAHLRVELIADLARALLPVRDLLEIAEERLGRNFLRRESRRPANGAVRGDDHDVLAIAMLRRKAFEQRVGVLRVAD